MSHLKENNLTPKITVLAITLNEEENVKKYVQSFSFADEIIFIDGYSTDATVSLAKELGVTVIQRTFDDFATQRNFALQQSNNDWVLFFDLDENITPELAEEIQMILSSGNNFSAYYVKSNFHFMGKQMKFGGCNPKKSIRIFKKQSCYYNESLVHEKLIIQGKTAVLKNHSNHYAYKNFDTYNENNLFSS
jgi:glycosyltransferase involved in cell wall biosynthesis